MAEPKPTNHFTHLWNDMSFTERSRLQPYQTEAQIRYVLQARQMLVRSHQRTLNEIDDWVRNLQFELEKHRAEREQDNG